MCDLGEVSAKRLPSQGPETSYLVFSQLPHCSRFWPNHRCRAHPCSHVLSSPWEPPWYRSPARGPDSSHHNSPGIDRVSELASWRTIERLTSRMGDGFPVGTRCPLPPETDGDKCPKIREGREISSLIFNQKCKFILIFNVFVSSPGPGSHPSMVLLCCAPSHHPKPL